MVYALILTFYMWTGSNIILETAVAPGEYSSKENCDKAGQMARDNYNGGALVEWTCTVRGPEYV